MLRRQGWFACSCTSQSFRSTVNANYLGLRAGRNAAAVSDRLRIFGPILLGHTLPDGPRRQMVSAASRRRPIQMMDKSVIKDVQQLLSSRQGADDLVGQLNEGERNSLLAALWERDHQYWQEQYNNMGNGKQVEEAAAQEVSSHRWQSNAAAAFSAADLDKDGILTMREFEQFLAARNAIDLSPPPRDALFRLFFASGVPFFAFGFMDNFIMIVAGESIEYAVGGALGLSTMAAAGLGNMVSDCVGVVTGDAVDRFAKEMGLQPPGLSDAQLQHKSAKRVVVFASAVGVAIGCIFGMVPLLFID